MPSISTVVKRVTFHTVSETAETVSVERRKMALRDAKKQGLFSTSVGSQESPPESEPQVFVLSNIYTIQGLFMSHVSSLYLPIPQAESVPA